MAKGVNIYVRVGSSPPKLAVQNMLINDFDEITVVVPIEVTYGVPEEVPPRAERNQKSEGFTGCGCDICVGMGGG